MKTRDILQSVVTTVRRRPRWTRIIFEKSGVTGPRLFATRYPVLAAFVLVLLPMPFVSSGRFGSLFVLTYPQLFSVSLATVWAAITVVAMIQMALRAANEPIATMTPKRWATAVGFLVAPMLIRCILDSSTSGLPAEFAGEIIMVVVGCGIAAATVVLGAKDLQRFLPSLRGRLLQSAKRHAGTRLARLLRILAQHSAALTHYAQRDTLLRAFLALVAIVYVIGIVGRPPAQYVPALCYLLLVFSVVTAVVAFAAALLDQYGVPVAIVLAILTYGGWFCLRPPHVFHVKVTPQRQRLLTPKEVAARGQGPVVLIAAGGGGMRAAVWEAAVVEQLQRACPAFLPSVQFVSAVSGGSVGAMYLFDSLDATRMASETAIHGALKRASVSSLQELAWTLTYPRMVRWLRRERRYNDLADALEATWLSDWDWQRRRLSQWRQALVEGQLPAISMNTSVDVTGTALLLANFDVPADTWIHEDVRPFQKDLNSYDMDIVTAARLSATFPFVTPMASPDAGPHREEYRLADGGYFDNSGLYVQFLWMQEVMGTLESQHRPVVLVEISSTSNAEEKTSDHKLRTNLQKRAQATLPPLILPVTTWLNSQGASEVVRDWLLRQAIVEQAKDHHVPLTWATFRLYNVPASWEMTPSQLQHVTDSIAARNDDVSKVASVVCAGAVSAERH
jgi:Patatin-like phospholipase